MVGPHEVALLITPTGWPGQVVDLSVNLRPGRHSSDSADIRALITTESWLGDGLGENRGGKSGLRRARRLDNRGRSDPTESATETNRLGLPGQG